ncbi:MAG: KpsF/GutQ family sugar-phosphate isomerase [Pseudomonadales bacterium]|nr:KpsF/GutQ family sugar-phosphate isomerase [Pseudomonadales bacterium]MCP5359036.1 KpsF/GutQ family sugar-phosphate isomerase [Pseudomonadales bacterium]
MSEENYLITRALRTIDIEHRAIGELRSRLDHRFVEACELMLACKGRIVVMGMGKSGHIGRKIAATLSSTGSPAMFVHPGEASHGDLGMITDQDVVLAISYSGSAAEIMTILPVIKRKGVPLICMTGDPQSAMATTANVHLDGSVHEEACPLGLAPTTSTTVALVLGDALAMALLEARGFTPEEFAFSHPGGRLGRRLLLKVKDVMHAGDAIPRVAAETLLGDALLEISRKGLGMTTVVDAQGKLCGVFTDGDLRRTLDSGKDIHKTRIQDVMSVHGKKIQENALATEAVLMMQENSIYTLLVTDAAQTLTGVIRMHDLLQANVV